MLLIDYTDPFSNILKTTSTLHKILFPSFTNNWQQCNPEKDTKIVHEELVFHVPNYPMQSQWSLVWITIAIMRYCTSGGSINHTGISNPTTQNSPVVLSRHTYRTRRTYPCEEYNIYLIRFTKSNKITWGDVLSGPRWHHDVESVLSVGESWTSIGPPFHWLILFHGCLFRWRSSLSRIRSTSCTNILRRRCFGNN